MTRETGTGADGGGYWNAAPDGRERAGEIEVAVRGLPAFRLATASHTFSPRRLDPGTALLLETLLAWYGRPDVAAPARIVDLGAGAGALGLGLALRFPAAEVDLIEVNRRAAATAAANAGRLGLERARVHEGDVAAIWPRLAPHDLAVTNPPIRAGRAVYAPWFEASARQLAPGGAFWFVARTAQGAASLAALLNRCLDEVAVTERKSGYKVVRGIAPRRAPMG